MTIEPHDEPESGRTWKVALLGIVCSLLLLIWWPGCRQYPEVTSPESLRLMKMLYAACNTRNVQRLDRTVGALDKLVREGKVTPAEKDSFSRIVETARQGRWEEAEKAAFRFAQDQVR